MALPTSADREISRLLDENRQLIQDIKQTQADKDFVWSLWKKLQVSNPDMTQAVGLVVQRERDKAEQRDRKVLEILQRKDEKIEELQANLSYRGSGGDSAFIKLEAQEELLRMQRQMETLQDRNATLELKLKNIESREKKLENVHSEAVQKYERERWEMSERLQNLATELEKARSDKADEMALRVQMESKVRVFDKEAEQKMSKFQQLVQELEEARELLRRFESQMRQQQQDLEYKNQELETVRKELAELWCTHNQLTEHSSQQADLIRQIQSLQTDTQKMMRNQEEAYSLESTSLQQMYTDLTGRYDTAKKAESELRSQVLGLKKELLDRDDVIAELKLKYDSHCRRYDDISGSFLANEKVEPVLDLEYKVKSMQKEIDNLRKQLIEKEGCIEQLEQDAINQTIEFDVARLNRHERTHSTPSREFRSIGVSPLKNVEGGDGGTKKSKSLRSRSEVRSKYEVRTRSVSPVHREHPQPRFHIQNDLDNCKTILKLKIRELAELKKAHQKRQERLKVVQDNYKNVKEQLKTLEAEYYGSKNKQKKVKRADPKDLRHEDSPSVWNELAYFKNENRNLNVERMALEEELDNLRVQYSQDAATIHELRVTLEQEREERTYDKKKTDKDLEGIATQKSEIVLLKSEVQNKQVTIDRLERDISNLQEDRDTILEEKKLLKQEIIELKQDAAQHRMDQTDLKRDIQRLKRELEEEKSLSKLNTAQVAPQLVKALTVKAAKSRRKGLRNRINFNASASKKFDELIEEGWEELSEHSEADEETPTDTLGQKIVHKSRQHGTPIADSSTTDTSQEILDSKRKRSIPMKPPPRTCRHMECRHNSPLKHLQGSSNNATPPMPVHSKGMSVSNRIPSSHIAIMRQLKPMKQRVGYLQQQVSTLRESRAAAIKLSEELKEANAQLQADLNLANHRQRASKQSIQKLNNDLDKVHQEKKEMETKLSQKMDNIGLVSTGHTEQDWKILDSRLKSCTNELSRQNTVVRQLKQDNDLLNDQIRILQDKMNRAERDSSQKRSLLENQKSRVKQALETAKADAESLEQLETRMKLLQDTNDKQKIQIDSYKKRLGAVTREKRDYEERFLKITSEVEKKNKLLLDSQTKTQDLEMSLLAMEKMATQQMKNLATESEEALEAANEKLKEIRDVLKSYQRFVRNLAQEIVWRTQQVRVSLKDHEFKRASTDKSNASLKQAQDLAKDILNLSQTDLDDIMSADGDANKMENELEADKRRDRKWAKKVEQTQNLMEDFAMQLVELFVQKIEERVELTAKYHSSKTSQSGSSLQAT